MRAAMHYWYKVVFISLILILTNTTSTLSKELKVEIGYEKETVINRLGYPNKSKLFKNGKERLFYNDLMVDIRDNKVVIIRSTKDYKDSIFSVRLGDNAYRVKKILGEPDEAKEDQLVYYNYKGNYIRFHLDKKRKGVNSFFIRKGSTKEAMEKRKKMLASLIEKGLIPSDEELRSNLLRKVAHERVTEREYKKNKRNSQRFSTKYHTITGLLKDKNPVLSPVEKSHDIERKMNKFVVEYKATEDGVTKRILQNCFWNRYVTSLRKKLDSLSIGDRVTVRGRWKYLEDKKKTKKKDLIIEHLMSMSIFLVDRIE